MNISLTSLYTKHGTFRERLDEIYSAGFSHLNLCSGICKELISNNDEYLYDLKELIVKSNLQIDWMHAPFNKAHIYSDDHDIWSLSVATLRMAVLVCGKIGAHSLVFHPVDDDFFSNKSRPEINLSMIEKAILLLIEEGQKHNVTIAIENLPGQQIRRALVHLFDRIEDLFFCFDVGHAQLDNSTEFYLSEYSRKIVALHIHDNHGKRDDHLIPGDGIIDLRLFFKSLNESGYQGIWGLECIQKDDNYEGGLELAEKAFKNTVSLLEEAGDR